MIKINCKNNPVSYLNINNLITTFKAQITRIWQFSLTNLEIGSAGHTEEPFAALRTHNPACGAELGPASAALVGAVTANVVLAKRTFPD